MTERTLPVFLLVSAAVVAICILIGVWWLAIPVVAIILPGPFVTPAILQKLTLKRRGANFQRSVRRTHAGFTDDDSRTLT